MQRKFVVLGVGVVAVALVVGIGSYAIHTARPRQYIADATAVRLMWHGAHDFAQDNGGVLPGVEDWKQTVLYYSPDVSKFSESDRPFAMNEHLSSFSLSDIADPGSTVLFFECAIGSPNSGGPELLPPVSRNAGGYVVVFANGNVEAVTNARLLDLVWQP